MSAAYSKIGDDLPLSERELEDTNGHSRTLADKLIYVWRTRKLLVCLAGIALAGTIFSLLADQKSFGLRKHLTPCDDPNSPECLKVRYGPSTPLALSVKNSEDMFSRHLAKRNAFIEKHGGVGSMASFTQDRSAERVQRWTLWDVFVPSWNCPFETERIGDLADGGKYVCGLSRIQETRGKRCVVYSFGVERESSWEAEILERTDCEIFMFDFSVDQFGPQLQTMDPAISRRAHFFKYGIGERDEVIDGNEFYTLSTLMSMLGHDWIDMLKVDVEGAEFKILPGIVNEFGDGNLPFGQLMLEIHTYALERRNNFEDFAAWWRQLEAAGLRAYSSELNYPSYAWLEEPMAIEMNWINNCLGEKACGTLVRDVPDRAVDGLGPPRSARSY